MIAKHETDESPFGELLDWEEIRRRHPNRWVVLADPVAAATEEVTAGRVAWCGEDRNEACSESVELDLDDAAILYTGNIAAGTRFLL